MGGHNSPLPSIIGQEKVAQICRKQKNSASSQFDDIGFSFVIMWYPESDSNRHTLCVRDFKMEAEGNTLIIHLKSRC